MDKFSVKIDSLPFSHMKRTGNISPNSPRNAILRVSLSQAEKVMVGEDQSNCIKG